jgi:hypothetical protein
MDGAVTDPTILCAVAPDADRLAEEVNDKENVLQKAADSNGAATPSSPTGVDNSGFSELGLGLWPSYL